MVLGFGIPEEPWKVEFNEVEFNEKRQGQSCMKKRIWGPLGGSVG